MRRWFGVVVGLLVATPAPAAPAWSDAAGKTFHVEAYQVLPVPIWLPATKTTMMRVDAVHTRLLTTCTQAPGDTPAVWCRLDDIAISAQPWSSLKEVAEEGDEPLPTTHPELTAVLEEMDADLTGRSVRLAVDPDGRPTGLELLGGDGSTQDPDPRTRVLAHLLYRAFAGFDLPPTHDTPLSTFALLGYPMDDASMAEVRLQTASEDDARVTTGRGTLWVQTSRWLFNASVSHEARVNDSGALIEADWLVVATPRGSANVQSAYVQVGAVRSLGDAQPPDLGASVATYSVPRRFAEQMNEAWTLSRRLAPSQQKAPPPPVAAHAWVRVAGGATARAACCPSRCAAPLKTTFISEIVKLQPQTTYI